MSLSRRNFMGLAGGAASAAVVGGIALNNRADGKELVLPRSATPTAAPSATAAPPLPVAPVELASDRRVLVVVQMAGGNDGLNTLIPTESGRYRDLRPSLAIDEAELVGLQGDSANALHPALAPLAPMWDAGQLAAINTIGMPEQSRSHFVALDTWWAGGPDKAPNGGWLGRWLDATHNGEPDPMRSIALGGGAPALFGQQSSPVVVQSLTGFNFIGPNDTGAAAAAFGAMAAPSADGLLAAAQEAIPVAMDAVDQLRVAFNSGSDSGAAPNVYEEESAVALFGAAGDIIEAQLGTEVILINLGGFDTHANQLNRHSTLLGDLGTGISGLFERLALSGHAGRTLLMTYSEFGRRVGENGSGGTDHGSGGLGFLAGPGLTGSTIVGEPDLSDLDQGDLRATIDSRSLYANALDWLGGPTDEVLGGTWDTYGLVDV